MKYLTGPLLALLLSTNAAAQSNETPDQFGARLDARLFDAYNRCELEAFGALLAEEVEFYHDKSGLMTGRGPVVDAVRNNICGKVERQLVAGSLRSYPMDNYGLVQLGEHRFCTPGTGTCNGSGRFVHLWKRDGEAWILTRIISYDHAPL